MLVASLSGIRGVLNEDFGLADASRFAGNFARGLAGGQILVGRDTRSTGPAISKAVCAALMAEGAKVVDYGVVSTPAIFRESRVLNSPAVMVTASHNEPEFNGLKFLVGGQGAGPETFERVMSQEKRKEREFLHGTIRGGRTPSYADDLVSMFGQGVCEGVRVGVDLGGGAAIAQSVSILRRVGCEVYSLNDVPGAFNRKVDPVADDLALLRRTVRDKGLDLGLGFDCDGDRLVIVDSEGRKRTGDYMLTLVLSELLAEAKEKDVVVSLDTTQAVDDVAKKSRARVHRSKVGEANVVSMMKEKGASLGGEGSSGGLIDGSFNYCRDSMLAALVLARAIRRTGPKLFGSVPAYHIERTAMRIEKGKAMKAMKAIASRSKDPDLTDGVKVRLSAKSWVLLRPSGTENSVRVSAEAETAARAVKIVKEYSAKLKEMSR